MHGVEEGLLFGLREIVQPHHHITARIEIDDDLRLHHVRVPSIKRPRASRREKRRALRQEKGRSRPDATPASWRHLTSAPEQPHAVKGTSSVARCKSARDALCVRCLSGKLESLAVGRHPYHSKGEDSGFGLRWHQADLDLDLGAVLAQGR